MTAPTWLRHLLARILVRNSSEVGGVVYDYANGNWKMLEVYNTEEGMTQAMEVLESAVTSGRDDIYVAMGKVRSNGRAGSFSMIDTDLNIYERFFWQGIYEPEEAYYQIIRKCRESAKRMGYRQEEE
jgi:hypothetical protein